MLKRACTQEQINERKNEIIQVTNEMFDAMDYHDISMKTISERISIARSSLYCYYNSKEEIMLDILKINYIDFLNDLIKGFASNTKDIVDTITNVYLNHIRLLKIVSIYLTEIEIHCTLDKLVEFKSALIDKLNNLKNAIQKNLNTTNEKTLFIFNALLMLTHSLYPMIHPVQVQIDAMKIVGMDIVDNPYNYCYAYIKNILK